MTTQNALLNISLHDLKQAIGLKEQIERLQSELAALLGGGGADAPASKAPGKRTMSATARARIGAAQKARWAKIRGGKPGAGEAAPKAKRKLSVADRARLSARAQARWAKIKKAGGKSLKAA
ncbi:MAG: hypothetical protein ACYDH9_20175 [Limisphaerales bacterium]